MQSKKTLPLPLPVLPRFRGLAEMKRERKEQKQDAGFSVVFGSTGRSGSAGGRAGANVEWGTHELLVGGVRWHAPREICKIGISKMQFPAYPGPKLVNREVLLRH